MKIKSGYSLIPHNEVFLITYNDEPLKTAHLSIIGAFLWKKLVERELSNAELLELLLDNFEISTVLALGEIDIFIKTLKENGIFEE